MPTTKGARLVLPTLRRRAQSVPPLPRLALHLAHFSAQSPATCKSTPLTNDSAAPPSQASLVTTADRSTIPRRDNEPTGEAETLVGRIDPKSMGSRAFKEDVDLEGKRKKAEKERERREKKEEGPLGGRKKVAAGVRYGNVLEATQDRE